MRYATGMAAASGNERHAGLRAREEALVGGRMWGGEREYVGGSMGRSMWVGVVWECGKGRVGVGGGGGDGGLRRGWGGQGGGGGDGGRGWHLHVWDTVRRIPCVSTKIFACPRTPMTMH